MTSTKKLVRANDDVGHMWGHQAHNWNPPLASSEGWNRYLIQICIDLWKSNVNVCNKTRERQGKGYKACRVAWSRVLLSSSTSAWHVLQSKFYFKYFFWSIFLDNKLVVETFMLHSSNGLWSVGLSTMQWCHLWCYFITDDIGDNTCSRAPGLSVQGDGWLRDRTQVNEPLPNVNVCECLDIVGPHQFTSSQKLNNKMNKDCK